MSRPNPGQNTKKEEKSENPENSHLLVIIASNERSKVWLFMGDI
jgi:hypothetical protein